MIPGSLVLKTKAKPDHRASGLSPRRARPFGRAIEVFVPSRDDDADYKNAVGQNASVQIVFPQEPPFTFAHLRQIRPNQTLLEAVELAPAFERFTIEQPQCRCALIEISPRLIHHRDYHLYDARL